jgi:hypothetical protein
MRRVFVLSILALVLLSGTLPHGLAQPPSDPIILLFDGDLWAWQGQDQPLVQLTDWGMNDQMVISPDGTRVAYTSFAKVFADWLHTVNGAGGFVPPENIWLLDIPSGQTFRIADQQPDAIYTGPDPTDLGRFTVRTAPSWSPDGQQLAWLEILIDTLSASSDEEIGIAQLVVYDLVSQTSTVLDTFTISQDTDYIELYEVNWGRPGIALIMRQLSDEQELRLYSPSSDLITQFTLETPNLSYTQWIADGDQDYLIRRDFNETQWFNWQTQESESITGNLGMVSLTSPDGARFTNADQAWQLTFSGESSMDMGDQIQPFGISRDGQWVVYGRWEDGEYILLVQSKDASFQIGRYRNVQVVWGPVGWQVSH